MAALDEGWGRWVADLLGALKGLRPQKRIKTKCSDAVASHPGPQLLFRWLRGKVLKHLLDAFVQILDVLVGVVGERVAGHTTPDQGFCFCVKKINNERAHFVGIYRSG